eukprot:SAG31_NODE_6117_length_2162_cov_1.509937_1_plen_72_part_00
MHIRGYDHRIHVNPGTAAGTRTRYSCTKIYCDLIVAARRPMVTCVCTQLREGPKKPPELENQLFDCAIDYQ